MKIDASYSLPLRKIWWVSRDAIGATGEILWKVLFLQRHSFLTHHPSFVQIDTVSEDIHRVPKKKAPKLWQ